MKSLIAVSLLALVAPICAIPHVEWSSRYHQRHSLSDHTEVGTSHHLLPTGLPTLSVPVGPPFPNPTGVLHTRIASEFPTGGPTAGPYHTGKRPSGTRPFGSHHHTGTKPTGTGPFGSHRTGTTPYVKERRAIEKRANDPKSESHISIPQLYRKLIK